LPFGDYKGTVVRAKDISGERWGDCRCVHRREFWCVDGVGVKPL
jgi:hypothetical protein